MSSLPYIVTFDGPASSGKSSVAAALARRLGYQWMSTGRLYRLVALLCQKRALLPHPPSHKLRSLVEELQQCLAWKDSGGLALLARDQQELELAVEGEEAGLLAAQVAQIPALRTALLPLQRRLAYSCSREGVVFDGRDMGTVVFAELAFVKFYLKADLEVRALRRWRHLNPHKEPQRTELMKFVELLRLRDREDEQRHLAPLLPASDAIIIDTSKNSFDEVVDRVHAHMKEAFADRRCQSAEVL